MLEISLFFLNMSQNIVSNVEKIPNIHLHVKICINVTVKNYNQSVTNYYSWKMSKIFHQILQKI